MGLQESAGGHVDNLVVTAQQAGPIPLNASFRCAPGELLALVELTEAAAQLTSPPALAFVVLGQRKGISSLSTSHA